METKQTKLFEIEKNDWEKDWIGMPEYNNTQQNPPEITATFKFRTDKDYLKFARSIQFRIAGTAATTFEINDISLVFKDKRII